MLPRLVEADVWKVAPFISISLFEIHVPLSHADAGFCLCVTCVWEMEKLLVEMFSVVEITNAVTFYLFGSRVRRGDESVSLANDDWVHATPDGVHQPMGVVIVDYMEESPSTSWHPLYQAFSKVIVCECNLHISVFIMLVVCPKQEYLCTCKFSYKLIGCFFYDLYL